MSTVRVVACSRTHTPPYAAHVVLLKYDEDPDALPPVLAKHRRVLVDNLACELASAFSWREVDTLDTMLALPGPEAQLGADGPTWAEHLRRQDAALGLRGTLRAVLACTVREDKPGVVVSNKAGSADATDDSVVGPLEHDALAERLLVLSEKVLGHSGFDRTSLTSRIAYLERWLPQTMREREERAAALAIEEHAKTPIAERYALSALRDQLARETRSAQAASAIADELSVALEKSRERLGHCEEELEDRDAHLQAIRAALGCDDGATTIVAEVTRLREACAATVSDLQDRNAAIDAASETVGRLMRALEGCLIAGPTGGNVERECAEVGLEVPYENAKPIWTRSPWVAPETPLAVVICERDGLAARVAALEAQRDQAARDAEQFAARRTIARLEREAAERHTHEVEDLRNQVAALEERLASANRNVDALTRELDTERDRRVAERQSHEAYAADLRDRMADPEGMSHAVRHHPLERE